MPLTPTIHFVKDNQMTRAKMPVDQPPDARVLRVAVIGGPNAGKSTLINCLSGMKVKLLKLI